MISSVSQGSFYREGFTDLLFSIDLKAVKINLDAGFGNNVKLFPSLREKTPFF